MEKKFFDFDFGGKKINLEISNLAEGIDFFPLVVDYEEKFYAAGKMIGSKFIKRENRPSDNAILSGRLVDRAIRPLFNPLMRNEIQMVSTVLSIDDENDPDVLSLIASSAALAASDIPWNGPIGAVRVGRVNGKFLLNPTYKEREDSDLDLIIAGVENKINMIEAGSKETPEDVLIEAFKFAQGFINKLIGFQKEVAKKIGKKKMEVALQQKDPELISKIKEFLGKKIYDAVFEKDKLKRQANIDDLKKSLNEYLTSLDAEESDKMFAEYIYEEEVDRMVHEEIIKNNHRPDGRKADELRNIESYVNILPRTHGSGIFMRGETHVLTVLTLGSPGDEQTIDTMEALTTKRFMHHYNFPRYSVGETGSSRGPGRREIGHGALAERALSYVIPSKEKFPYTIRLVSEVMSSNGSSSMASTCGSTLALMDGGVPIKSPVAGIAMGLMLLGEDYKILTDIQGPEDHYGDMDFKVAGTKDGVTALQMDVKVEGATIKMLEEGLSQAKKARLQILDVMEKAINAPRENLSPFAPRIFVLKINPEKIGDVIGPGGKMINKIIKETGAKIDIEQTGEVFISAINEESAQKAIKWVNDLTREVKPGESFQGKVMRLMNFGAFVEILPGQEGMVHISEMSTGRVDKVEDMVKLGQEVSVRVKEIDSQGRINLTMLSEEEEKEKAVSGFGGGFQRRPSGGPPKRFGDRRPRY
ncbi:MAG: Polyribonucleotide nucleotidyltransferase [candidate division CPR1 bacterium GW2011_GWA2_42_17]|uniref:Polyribonucleotide nucleotidyltransferase n=1 Tax=candidate division CPR1 bacterium GW2011_GWA2_42_17 TaxID=1618341 RepID=A0A0G1BE35_9BACT|nr:MAG: Polyribonucleotide nucleotidyltransferase [candidate division CPR1 bacterium GW2011_GWA2_42_17]